MHKTKKRAMGFTTIFSGVVAVGSCTAAAPVVKRFIVAKWSVIIAIAEGQDAARKFPDLVIDEDLIGGELSGRDC